MEVLVLSNVNLAPLARRVPGHGVSFGEYGDVLRALADPASSAHAEGLDALAVVLDADELFESGDLVSELPAALATFAVRRPDVLVVASTLRPDPVTVATYAAAQDLQGRDARAAAFDAALRDLATAAANVLVLDLGLVFAHHGRDALISRAFWYAGRIPYTTLWFEECGKHLSGLFAAYRGAARKVLVCDLDETLWGGVLGEDGRSGIALGEDGVGRCYRDLQRRIKALQETGVLLALVSKNDHDEVAAVLDDHPMMVLRAADFAAVRVNWTDKVTNLRDLSAELSLGLDSFVFLDDNPFERALVSEHLPEVAVPIPPSRPELQPDWFVREVVFPHFSRVKVLETDRARTEQYRARTKRNRAGESLDLHAFLQGLEIRLDLRVDDEFLAERSAQMTQKTNQFNLTARRSTVPEILAWVGDDDHAVVTLGYADRFGDEGVVGLAVLERSTALVPVFLLSCRVIGREVENQLLDRVEAIARESGLAMLECTFMPTARNDVASGFLVARGWAAEPWGVDGAVRYRTELA